MTRYLLAVRERERGSKGPKNKYDRCEIKSEHGGGCAWHSARKEINYVSATESRTLRLICVHWGWAAGYIEGAAPVLVHAQSSYYCLLLDRLAILISPTGFQDQRPAFFTELLGIFHVVGGDPFNVVTRERSIKCPDASEKHLECAFNLRSMLY